ncbi:MAG: ABC transporter ATP-binding protein [Kiritimatiellae bacterium]|nr:ABC transporter ATP-binding protein [Kiritimatiellia bacterium]
MSVEAILEARGLFKSYTMAHGRVDVLRGASLSVYPGETVAILGRSGAGKSTLLNVLGGLDDPDGGEILFRGAPFSSLPEAARTKIRAAGIGFVFQSYHLMPEMTILENAMLPAMATGRLGRAGMYDRARALLQRAGLGGRLAHRPPELSGGEQQRVAIVRALINDPTLVLADEPTGNLDAATGAAVLDFLFEMVSARGSAMAIVTHDKSVAAKCSRRVTLENGAFGNGGADAPPPPCEPQQPNQPDSSK